MKSGIRLPIFVFLILILISGNVQGAVKLTATNVSDSPTNDSNLGTLVTGGSSGVEYWSYTDFPTANSTETNIVRVYTAEMGFGKTQEVQFLNSTTGVYETVNSSTENFNQHWLDTVVGIDYYPLKVRAKHFWNNLGEYISLYEIMAYYGEPSTPSIPVLHPHEDYHTTGVSTNVVWDNSTDDMGIIFYDVRVGASPGVSDVLLQYGISSNTSNIWELVPPTHYYWSARACGTFGTCSEWAAEDDFQYNNINFSFTNTTVSESQVYAISQANLISVDIKDSDGTIENANVNIQHNGMNTTYPMTKQENTIWGYTFRSAEVGEYVVTNFTAKDNLNGTNYSIVSLSFNVVPIIAGGQSGMPVKPVVNNTKPEGINIKTVAQAPSVSEWVEVLIVVGFILVIRGLYRNSYTSFFLGIVLMAYSGYALGWWGGGSLPPEPVGVQQVTLKDVPADPFGGWVLRVITGIGMFIVSIGIYKKNLKHNTLIIGFLMLFFGAYGLGYFS